MKRPILFCIATLFLTWANAQVDSDEFNKQLQQMREQYNQAAQQSRQEYANFRRQAEADYAAFRKKANEEYAQAVQKAWTHMGIQAAEPKPAEPPAPRPPAPVPDRIPTTIRLPQSTVEPALARPTPQPLPPIPEPEPEVPTLQFDLYSTPCNVHADKRSLQFRLSGTDENSIAKAWQELSQEKYDGLLHDCLAQREALHLADWGYLQLLQNMSEQLLGKGSNEAVLLQMYLFAQSGYRVRMAREDNRLVLLVPFNRSIYNYSYITLDGIKHYVLSKNRQKSIYVCSVSFPKEQMANILLTELPALNGNRQSKRSFSGNRFGTMQAEVAVDKNLINFLNDYPLSDAWDYYSLAGFSNVVKTTLYPALRSQIEGKSKHKAANMLLDFVQHAFQYATDQEQFGYERPLFGDESFYYPKNDCEDRSIVYSILVRELLGLDVVLVHWPGHLGTAVAFPEEVQGDYFVVDGRRYTVCDPTYIGADVGETMPQFKGVSAKIVRL